jgi:hypothetical protein
LGHGPHETMIAHRFEVCLFIQRWNYIQYKNPSKENFLI